MELKFCFTNNIHFRSFTTAFTMNIQTMLCRSNHDCQSKVIFFQILWFLLSELIDPTHQFVQSAVLPLHLNHLLPSQRQH